MSLAQRRLRIVALTMAVLAIGAFFGLREHSIAQLHQRIDAVHAEQTNVEAAMDELQTRLDRRDDLDYIEYLARKELGLIRPGEEKYLLITETESSATDGD